MSDPLAVARAAALHAGALIRERFGAPAVVESKGVVDLVTDVDREAERRIVERLRGAFPDDAILAEEGQGADIGGASRRWLVDPLDGTTNFAHGYPQVSVSIALEEEGEVVAGVVHDPLRDETFSARRGAGAWLGERAIRVSATRELSRGLVATGFPYDRRERADEVLARLRAVLVTAQGIRRAGSAALDLCAVACGRLDGYWEDGLKPWDVAAGALLVREAGGRVTDLRGEAHDLASGETVAGNDALHAELVATLAPALRPR